MKRFGILLLLVVLGWACSKSDEIQVLQPASVLKSTFEDYVTKADFRLPFDSSWYVYWGGRTVKQNYHRAYASQKFASDYTIVKKGVSFNGSKLVNESYYCFGVPLLAPAAGVVVAAVDFIKDNTPVGTTNPSQPMGNHVVIDHGNDEFSILCHFKLNSIIVEAGQRVQKGQKLGLCGNSGNSYEPHLHYQLNSTPSAFVKYSLPAQFQNYFADGRFIKRGEPLRGQYVKNKKQIQQGEACPVSDGW